jgi:hypothetical protein
MPPKSQNNQKATSPSKLVQHGIDQSWGQQNKGSTNPKQVLNQSFNKNPYPVPGSGRKK